MSGLAGPRELRNADAASDAQPRMCWSPPHRRQRHSAMAAGTSDKTPRASRLPAIIVGVIVAAIAGLSIWFLVRPQPLLVQGEVDATGSTSPRASTAASPTSR